MFSNDHNIETIGQLVDVARHYVGLQGEYVKLNVTEKTVRVLTALILGGVFVLLLLLACIYLGFAAAYAMSESLGLVAGFAIVAGFYLVVLLLFVIFRKRWIERPLVRFLATLLLSK
jgi:amino acid transporter